MIERRADTGMDDGAQRVRRELRDTVDLMCRTGAGLVFEEFPGALQEKPPPGGAAETDGSRVRATLDTAIGPYYSLLAVADALAETLAQLEAAVPGGHARSTAS